jgi:hypothetical protein
MSALETLLREQGMECLVEVHDRLAILVPDSTLHIPDRKRVVELARASGFTHVAIELDPDGATLPGD